MSFRLKYGGVGDDIEYTALLLENLNNRMLYMEMILQYGCVGDDIEYTALMLIQKKRRGKLIEVWWCLVKMILTTTQRLCGYIKHGEGLIRPRCVSWTGQVV
jgi:hypothetical protein